MLHGGEHGSPRAMPSIAIFPHHSKLLDGLPKEIPAQAAKIERRAADRPGV